MGKKLDSRSGDCVAIVFARESNDRSNLVVIRYHRDCHVHCRELAMTNVNYDTVSRSGMTDEGKEMNVQCSKLETGGWGKHWGTGQGVRLYHGFDILRLK